MTKLIIDKKKIAPSEYKDLKDIVAIFLTNKVKTIGIESFSGCTSLKQIMFGNDPLLTNVLEHSFSMTAVEIIKFPYTLIRIKSFAFQDCKNLRKVIFQDGSYLEEIGKSAFIGCDLLEKVFIPKNCIVRIYGTIFDFNGYIPQKELVEFLRTGIMPSLLIKYTKKEKDRREKEAKKKAEAKKYKINGKGTPLGQIPSANDSKGRHYHWYNTKK